VGYAVGRIGCFLRGDDYGIPTDLPWGLSFPKGLPPTTVKVHPTQIYETLASLVIFAIILWVMSPRFKREGPLIFVYAVFAGIERFLVEFIRTNDSFAWGLTQQQWIAIGMMVVGIVGAWWFETHGKMRPTPEQLVAVVASVSRGAKPGSKSMSSGKKGKRR
jgi:phosphatidylglycerol---prolipoprotein diacylglyceryl transferase